MCSPYSEVVSYSRILLIIDATELSVLCRKVVQNLHFIGANESFLYFQVSTGCVSRFDWNLNELPADSQFDSLPRAIYSQFEIRNETILLRIDSSIRIYTNTGALKETIELETNDTHFQVNNDKLIVFNRLSKSLKYYDLSGMLLKETQIESLNDVDNLNFRINKNGKIYFYFNQESSFVYF